MILCKNCKYWSSRVSYDVPSYRECDRESIRDYPSNGFAAVDGEPYNHDSIATGPEFGCILGEAKETTTKYYAFD